MNKSEYKELMAKIADGGKVSQKTFDEMVAFAKKAKTKRPPADSVLDTAEIKQAKVTKGKAKAKKEKAPKAKCSVTKAQDPKMSTKTCPNDARSNGYCATHYSRLIYRAQPEKAEKARQASRNYAARQRAIKAEQKKQAEAQESKASAA